MTTDRVPLVLPVEPVRDPDEEERIRYLVGLVTSFAPDDRVSGVDPWSVAKALMATTTVDRVRGLLRDLHDLGSAVEGELRRGTRYFTDEEGST